MAWDGSVAMEAGTDTTGAILAQLDALGRLIARRDEGLAAALDRRMVAVEGALLAQGLRLAAEATALREATEARLGAMETDWTARLAEIEDHAEARIDLQDRRVEALLAERDRIDAALAQAAGPEGDLRRRLEGTEERAARAEAEAGRMLAEVRAERTALEARVARMDAPSFEAGLAQALADCAQRLAEVSRQVEALALDRLPAGGLLGGALAALGARLAAIEARLAPGAEGEGDEALTFHRALAEWGPAAEPAA